MTTPPDGLPDWHTLYDQQRGDTLPWHYPALDPDLEAALAIHGPATGRFLDLGTGVGAQAIELAVRHYDVTGIDISTAAISQAIERAAAHGADVNFVADDVLAPRIGGQFDAVFDRGCFHVIDPASRPVYVASVAAWLAPGALLYLKCFSHLQPGTSGPHRFTPDQLRDTFAAAFDLLSATDALYQGNLETLPRALFCVLRRR